MATILQVNITEDQNDGGSDNGLSLREAILTANANPNTEYQIELTGGQTYRLTLDGAGEDRGQTGDLDITPRSNLLSIVTVGEESATIDASGLTNGDRVFHLLGNSELALVDVIVTGGDVTRSTNSNGGGILVSDSNSSLDLSNVTLTNNRAENGGGLYNVGSTFLGEGTQITDNQAIQTTTDPDSEEIFPAGGGIFNEGGEVTVVYSTIGNNESRYGGAIATIEGTVTLVSSTLANNNATDGGGGIANAQGTLEIVNTTISGNRAEIGGGIYNVTSGTADISNSTITNNTATNSNSAGGISQLFAYNISLSNTIVAGNLNTGGGPLDLSGEFEGNNHNLIGDLEGAEGTIGTGTDIVSANAFLGSLEDNGGLTLTHTLLPESPALNAGNIDLIPTDSEDIDEDGNTNESIPFDQRGTGFNRVFGDSVDIGAYEVQTILPLISIDNTTTTDDRNNSFAVFTVTLNTASNLPVTVDYETVAGTAEADVDYTSVSGTLTLNAGETTTSIFVPILFDTLIESSEEFSVILNNPTNAVLSSDSTGVATITDIDPAQYGASNPDLIMFFGYDLTGLREHYYTYGQFEGRSLDTFDEYGYLASYPDLFDFFGLDGNAATQHYITYGFAEGRDPKLFTSDRYIASYGDLIDAFGYDLEAGSSHYLAYGISEGRQVSFDPQAYLNRYADLQAVFGNDLQAATKHYIDYGYDEGRTWM